MLNVVKAVFVIWPVASLANPVPVKTSFDGSCVSITTSPSSVRTVSLTGGFIFVISVAVVFSLGVKDLTITDSPVALFSWTKLPFWSIAKFTKKPGAWSKLFVSSVLVNPANTA